MKLVLVPVEATEAMAEAGSMAIALLDAGGEQAYAAMLAARPPVDYDALAPAILEVCARLMREGPRGEAPDAHKIMAQALREVLP